MKHKRFPTNLLLAALMDKPSFLEPFCAVCGTPTTAGPHHVVRRSQGGLDGPVIRLCGSGTTGCHGEAEAGRLRFRWADGWEYIYAEGKYQTVLGIMDGWRQIPNS